MRFEQSHLKVKWADHHIAELEGWLAALPNSYVSSVEVDPASQYKRVKHDVGETGFRVTAALLVGDI